MRSVGAWARLAAVLSALWLVGISLYAAYGWHNAFERDTPFVQLVLVAPDGQEYLANRVPPVGVTYLQTPQPRFRWAYFLTVAGGVFAAIWVVTVGGAWVVSGFGGLGRPGG